MIEAAPLPGGFLSEQKRTKRKASSAGLLASLESQIRSHGEVDALMGFSVGADLAVALAARAEARSVERRAFRA